MTAALFTACEGPAGPPGKDGLNGLTSEWYTISLSVEQWQLAGERNQIGSYYYCLFNDIEQLTEYIYDEGLILCYYEYIDEFGDRVMSPLPFTLYNIEVIEGVEYPYAVQFSYDVTPGSIVLKLTYSDFLTSAQPPQPCLFKLVLVY
jgi:hypothetical protein